MRTLVNAAALSDACSDVLVANPTRSDDPGKERCAMTITNSSIAPAQKREGLTRRGGEPAPFGDFFSFSLDRIRDDFDRLFDRMTRQFSAIADFNGEGWRWGLAVDDQADAVVVRAEAPGFEPNDFDIRVQDGQLVLSAQRKTETKGEKDKPDQLTEQSCYESITLPAGIDKDKVDAKYRNGVLTVTIPKTAEGKAKKIAVKSD
jgi:HSP20 family protein